MARRSTAKTSGVAENSAENSPSLAPPTALNSILSPADVAAAVRASMQPRSEGPTPTSPKEARRQQRIETSREQILDTAEQLFAERGYHETGLKEVAAKCEFSVGSIYSFFESKDDLYEQVVMRRCIGIEALESLIPDSVPADDRLVLFAEIQIRHANEHPAWGQISAEMSRFGRSGSSVPEAWRQYGRRMQRYVVDVIERGQRDGTLRPGSPVALGRLYFAVVTAFILVSTIAANSSEEEGWPSDTEEFLGFVYDTFSARPQHVRMEQLTPPE